MDPKSHLYTMFDTETAAFREAGEDFVPNVETQLPDSTLNTKQCIKALVATQGNINKAARLLGIRRMRLVDWVDVRPEVQASLMDIREGALDDIIETQFNLAAMGDAATGRWLLSTIGKDRGYITRSETTGKDGTPLAPPSVDFARLSDAALKELKDAVETPDA